MPSESRTRDQTQQAAKPTFGILWGCGVSRILAFIWQWFCAVDRRANPNTAACAGADLLSVRSSGSSVANGDRQTEWNGTIEGSHDHLPPSIPAADSGMTLDDVRGDAVSTHIATGSRLSHDVPTLPVDITFAPIQVAALAEPFPLSDAETQLFTV